MSTNREPQVDIEGVRREFEMSPEQLAKIIEASRPVLYLVFGGIEPRSPQENANAAWRSLGEEMGFVWDTVAPVPGRGNTVFTAQAMEKSNG